MKNSGMIMFGIFGLVALYLMTGYFSVNGAEEDVAGRTGNVWNQIDAGAEKLGQLQSQVLFAYDDRQELVDIIAASHNDLLAAHKVGDMDAAMAAASDANFAVNALAEAMPEYDLSAVQTSLMDETAGTFNRISYARDQLIDSQVSYNKKLLMWPFMGSRMDVLGENADPRDLTGIPNQFDTDGD